MLCYVTVNCIFMGNKDKSELSRVKKEKEERERGQIT